MNHMPMRSHREVVKLWQHYKTECKFKDTPEVAVWVEALEWMLAEGLAEQQSALPDEVIVLTDEEHAALLTGLGVAVGLLISQNVQFLPYRLLELANKLRNGDKVVW